MGLFRRIHSLLGETDRTAVEKAERRMRVLLVDEDATARNVIARRLSHLNYDVVLMEDGHRALAVLVTRPVDVILIDMGLRLLPAIATLQKIRAANLAGDACLIMIADAAASAAVVEALAAGADDHVVKPFDFDVLSARIRHLRRRADQVSALTRYNAELDARIALRAVGLGETREALREMQADRARLVAPRPDRMPAVIEGLARASGHPAQDRAAHPSRRAPHRHGRDRE